MKTGAAAGKAFLFLCAALVTAAATTGSAAVTAQGGNEIAVDAYACFYPLVTMDVARRQMSKLIPADTDVTGSIYPSSFRRIPM